MALASRRSNSPFTARAPIFAKGSCRFGSFEHEPRDIELVPISAPEINSTI